MFVKNDYFNKNIYFLALSKNGMKNKLGSETIFNIGQMIFLSRNSILYLIGWYPYYRKIKFILHKSCLR